MDITINEVVKHFEAGNIHGIFVGADYNSVHAETAGGTVLFSLDVTLDNGALVVYAHKRGYCLVDTNEPDTPEIVLLMVRMLRLTQAATRNHVIGYYEAEHEAYMEEGNAFAEEVTDDDVPF